MINFLLAIPTPPTLTDEQKALAFTRQEYDLAEGVTGTVSLIL